MKTTARKILACLCLMLLGGCATLPPGTQRSPRDPWERMNRTTYKFNDKIDKAVLRPVARTYHRVTPQFMQTGFRNFMSNLSYPVTMVNDLLQGQFRPFLNDTGRLIVNTTLGIGGLFDAATVAGLDKNDRDFGQTLGKWGLKSGPYVVLPFLGPSDVRDTVGKAGDTVSDPRFYIKNKWWSWGLWGAGAIDARAQLLPADAALDSAYDPYAFMRNVYLQHRDFKVNGGQSTQQQDEQEQKLFDEASQDTDTPAKPAAAPPSSPDKPPPEKPQ
jgi:phospholipid-binding lipoprotein MlaA